MVKQLVGESRFWPSLWQTYAVAPSIALCRVPELEFAAALDVDGKMVLDHCCGDAIFAALAWPGKRISAGCDISADALALASGRRVYDRLEQCDVSRPLPFDEGSFDLVFNNSGLEHVTDLDAALAQIARVLKPGGRLVFNVLNARYFEWWPLDRAAADGYRAWQPFHHALDSAEWTRRLAAVGLSVADIQGYFPPEASRVLAKLDCLFSGASLAGRKSALVSLYRWLPGIMQKRWQQRLAGLTWRCGPEEGAGYCITAVRDHA